jgi:hypothetical protein
LAHMGELRLIGVKLSPKTERIILKTEGFSVRPSILRNIIECSPLGVSKGV